MNVLFYIPITGEVAERVHGVVDMVAPKAKTEVFQSIGDLSRRLSRPADSPTIAALLAANKEDLLKMISIRPLLSEIPLILILPDREESTTAMGYAMGPRFLTYADSNLTEVIAVLGKMAEKYNKKEVVEEWDNIWKS